jgi:hypothetical protein
MELTGTEKRIRALFSELSLEDHSRTPHFAHLWTRAAATKPSRRFSKSLAVTAAVIILGVAFSFTIWSNSITQYALNIAPLDLPTTAASQLAAAVVDAPRSFHAQRPKRIARPRHTDRDVVTEAALLSNWESPTSSLMGSPSSVSFNSLPQLNQSAKALETFLKESNQ